MAWDKEFVGFFFPRDETSSLTFPAPNIMSIFV